MKMLYRSYRSIIIKYIALLCAMMGADIARASDYKVGAGDVLKISVYRAPDYDTTTSVTQAGDIAFAGVGRVKVAGRSVDEIASALAAALRQREIFTDPTVTVLVLEYRSSMVSVLGAVDRPGEFPVDRQGMTIAQMLARAGANLALPGGTVSIINGDARGVRQTIAVSDIISGREDRAVRPGEVIFVQAPPTFYISGEVQKPGAYPIERGLTAGQAIALAGGLTMRGTQGRMRVTRKRDEVALPPAKIGVADPVQPGDLIVVGTRLF